MKNDCFHSFVLWKLQFFQKSVSWRMSGEWVLTEKIFSILLKLRNFSHRMPRNRPLPYWISPLIHCCNNFLKDFTKVNWEWNSLRERPECKFYSIFLWKFFFLKRAWEDEKRGTIMIWPIEKNNRSSQSHFYSPRKFSLLTVKNLPMSREALECSKKVRIAFL